ncbi:MAG TPA: hypothetical protein VHV78_06525, partial [Gemmatimonadaceae bacterium]|nr:hypothetical protein [Gemmatimonadaceae bacterium]
MIVASDGADSTVNVAHDVRRFATKLSRGPDSIWIGDDSTKLSYPDHGNQMCFQVEDTSFWFRHRNRCIVEMLRRLPPSGTVFDVGGGNGFVTAGLLKAGFDSILVEPGVD